MNRFPFLFGCFVFAGLLAGVSALCVMPAQQTPVQPVNAVLGDASFVATYGYPPSPSTPESVRIRTHLTYVERTIRQRSLPNLSVEQQSSRCQLLAHLRAYIKAGRFPANYDYPGERRPCFIDRMGAICAVGYLIEQSAGRKLAECINTYHQYDRINDMHLPALARWLAQSGLTLNECAMIQPGYITPGEPIYQTDHGVSTAYAIGSGTLNAANLTLGLLSFHQQRSGRGWSATPWLGVATGLGTMALGASQYKPGYTYQQTLVNGFPGGPIICPCYGTSQEVYTQYPARHALSWVNIGLGAVSTALNTWLLLRPKRASLRPSRTLYGIVPLPSSSGAVHIIHRF